MATKCFFLKQIFWNTWNFSQSDLGETCLNFLLISFFRQSGDEKNTIRSLDPHCLGWEQKFLETGGVRTEETSFLTSVLLDPTSGSIFSRLSIFSGKTWVLFGYVNIFLQSDSWANVFFNVFSLFFWLSGEKEKDQNFRSALLRMRQCR